jgi:hypothetical protein
MANSHGAQAKTYVSGRNLSDYLSSMDNQGENDKADVTVFSSVAKVYVSGLHDQTLSGEGVWDAAGTVGSDAVLGSAIYNNGSAIVSHFPAGDAIGAFGVGAHGIEVKYEVDTPVDDVNRLKFEAQSSRGFERLVSLEPLTASFTAGTAASVDNTAASSNGGAGYFHVTALNGGTIVGKVQHSTDNSNWSDLITFSNVTAGGSALVSTVTGTVNRYLRFNGTATGGTATIHAAFARVP